MTSTVTHEPFDNQPFQFRLAGLLWVMTGLAIATAVATPFLRQWTTSHWQYFGIAVSVFGLGAFGRAAISFTETQSRRNNIRCVGAPALRITTVAIFPQSFLGHLQANYPKFLLAMVVLGLLIPATELHERGKISAGAFAIVVAAGMTMFSLIAWCFARPEVVIGPHGLAFGNAFHAWKHIRATADDGCVRFALGKAMKLRVDLTPKELATVRAWYRAAKK